MNQHTGKANHSDTEIVSTSLALGSRKPQKKTLRAVGAAAVSAALVGVLALPAYATTSYISSDDDQALGQVLTTNNSADIVIPAHAPLTEVQPVTSSSTTNPVSISLPRDIPSGVGASGIVAAALAQRGIHQDCTDLVQNSLAAAGYVSRRDAGGPDLGPNLGDWARFGTQVSIDALAPGDVLVYAGSPHVAIYIGNGMAVHGGVYYYGGTAVLAVTAAYGKLAFAVRPA